MQFAKVKLKFALFGNQIKNCVRLTLRVLDSL
jgi:hypothetical protein